MTWFLNLSIRYKLLNVFSVLIVFLAGIIAVAGFGMSRLSGVQEILFSVELPISAQLAELRSRTNRERVIISRLLLIDEKRSFEQWQAEMIAGDKEILDNIEELKKLTSGIAAYAELVKKLEANRTAYDEFREKRILPLIKEGRIKEASNLLMGDSLDQYEKVREINLKLAEISTQRDTELKTESTSILENSMRLFLVLGIAAIVSAIAMAVYLTNILAGPLKNASAMAERTAYGDLTADPPVESRNDEVGKLFLSLGMMVSSLRLMTREILATVETMTSSMEKISAWMAQKENAAAREGLGDIEELTVVGSRLKKLVEQYRI